MNKAVLGTIVGAAMIGMANSKGSKNSVKYLPEDIFMRLIYGTWGPMAYLADIQDITIRRNLNYMALPSPLGPVRRLP